jgi:hypothetical protein
LQLEIAADPHQAKIALSGGGSAKIEPMRHPASRVRAYCCANAEKRVTDAAKAVLARAIEPAIADVVRAKAALFDALSVLHQLQISCVEPWPPSAEWTRLRSHLLVEARGGVCFEIDDSGNRAADRWASYAEQLKLDADAEPPSI